MAKAKDSSVGIILIICAFCCVASIVSAVAVYFTNVACSWFDLGFGSECVESTDSGAGSPAPGPARTPGTSGAPGGAPYSNPLGRSSNGDCPANYYESNGNCTSCPYGYTSPVGSKSVTSCVTTSGSCPQNTYKNGSSCIACPANSYSNQGSTSIDNCECGGNLRMKTDKSACEQCPLPQGYVYSSARGCGTRLAYGFAPKSRHRDQTCDTDDQCADRNDTGYWDTCRGGVCSVDQG